MNKTSLLELAKRLNIPHRNCVKTKAEVEYAIKDTIMHIRKSFLVLVFPNARHALMILSENLLGKAFKKIL